MAKAEELLLQEKRGLELMVLADADAKATPEATEHHGAVASELLRVCSGGVTAAHDGVGVAAVRADGGGVAVGEMVEHARPGGGGQRSTSHGSGEVRMRWGEVIIHSFSLSS